MTKAALARCQEKGIENCDIGQHLLGPGGFTQWQLNRIPPPQHYSNVRTQMKSYLGKKV